ncbi:hypothetical protein WMY93_008671 [Mugilogobius chulae]|uniref:NACHT domain-containing protein n=1 Tax=Mugilogobius chulae TaxID=88201 RepID=A0AAW0P9F3_9GOBI
MKRERRARRREEKGNEKGEKEGERRRTREERRRGGEQETREERRRERGERNEKGDEGGREENRNRREERKEGARRRKAIKPGIKQHLELIQEKMDSALSSVSLETDASKDCGTDSRRKLDKSRSKTGSKSRSSPGPGPGPGPSCESLKSDRSKPWSIEFKRIKLDKSGSKTRSKTRSSPGPGPSCESLMSDWSKGLIVDFKRASEAPGPGLSCESMQSERSKDWDLGFKDAPPEHTGRCSTSSRSVHKHSLEEQVLSFVKEQLKRLHRLLASDYPECLESEEEEEQSSREAVLTIALDFLKRLKQEEVAERLWSKSRAGVCSDKLKRRLQRRLSWVNQEHEVRHIQTQSRKAAAPETAITCEDMFKGPAHKQGPITEDLTEGPIRSVLTKGVAGVGKTVLTQKFSLDWAEGRTNRDIQLLFPFTFRELNVLRERQFSLVGLMQHFFSEAKGLCSFEQLQVLFIFDGLDECRLPLDFRQSQVLTEITECVSLDVLLVNLIRGSLLPPLASG